MKPATTLRSANMSCAADSVDAASTGNSGVLETNGKHHSDYLIGACAPVAGPALLCKTAALQGCGMNFGRPKTSDPTRPKTGDPIRPKTGNAAGCFFN